MVIRSTDFKLEKARILLYACFLQHNICDLKSTGVDENLGRLQFRDCHSNQRFAKVFRWCINVLSEKKIGKPFIFCVYVQRKIPCSCLSFFLRLCITQKAFQCHVLLFSLPPSRWSFRTRLAKVFLPMFLSFVSQEACDQDCAYFIGHTGKCFLQCYVYCEVSCL